MIDASADMLGVAFRTIVRSLVDEWLERVLATIRVEHMRRLHREREWGAPRLRAARGPSPESHL